MCGIAGIVNASVPPDKLHAALTRMEHALYHRGPDEGATVVFPEIRAGLAARRLSIVDLQHGSQPVANEDGTVLVMLNGEIYNHHALREELLARGHRFRSHSDTEVIVHLYEEHREACLEHLHGMFAIAVLDTRQQRLLLARDGPGMKPLYFAEIGHGFLFASEAKALFASGLLRPEPSLSAIDTFLAVGFIPAPMSAFRGIEKLRAGHYLVLEPGGPRRGVFWRYHYWNGDPPKPDAAYAAELETLLSDAVRSHMAADVPVGAFLSGGWDSSLTATLAAHHASERLKTFSIIFPDDPEADESRFSRRMAKYLGTDHYEIEYRNSLLPDLLPKISRHLEEPCANVPTAVVYWLTSLAGAHGKAVISGEGSDELFGGYDRFRIDYPYLVRRIFPKALARIAASRCTHPRLRRGLRIVGAADDRTADAEWFRGLTPEDKRLVLKPEYQVDGPDLEPLLIRRDELATCADRIQRRLSLDFTGRLADAILFTTDKMSMAHSLEVRTPFLDRSVIEFALRLPSRLKVHGGREKVVLAALARKHLPGEIAARRKQGLAFPPGCWRRPPVDGYVRELLLDGAGNSPFDGRYLERNLPRWLQSTRKGRGPIHRLVSLQSWWNEFLTSSPFSRG